MQLLNYKIMLNLIPKFDERPPFYYFYTWLTVLYVFTLSNSILLMQELIQKFDERPLLLFSYMAYFFTVFNCIIKIFTTSSISIITIVHSPSDLIPLLLTIYQDFLTCSPYTHHTAFSPLLVIYILT